MTVTNKDFKVKNGLNVAGDATFSSNLILGNTPLSFNTETNRLQILIDNAWKTIATLDDISQSGGPSLFDYDLNVDYSGHATWTLSGNNTGQTIILDCGTPQTNMSNFQIDAGSVTV